MPGHEGTRKRSKAKTSLVTSLYKRHYQKKMWFASLFLFHEYHSKRSQGAMALRHPTGRAYMEPPGLVSHSPIESRPPSPHHPRMPGSPDRWLSSNRWRVHSPALTRRLDPNLKSCLNQLSFWFSFLRSKRSSTLSIPDVKANEPTGDGGSGRAMLQCSGHSRSFTRTSTDLVAAARALAAGAPSYRCLAA